PASSRSSDSFPAQAWRRKRPSTTRAASIILARAFRSWAGRARTSAPRSTGAKRPAMASSWSGELGTGPAAEEALAVLPARQTSTAAERWVSTWPPWARGAPSDLEPFRDPGQVAGAGARHQGHVLDPHPPQAEVVEARFHGHDVTGAQGGGPLADG